MSLASGTMLGPYEIGADGMSELYIARDQRLNRCVAQILFGGLGPLHGCRPQLYGSRESPPRLL
jgi:hypothetical protein